MIAFLLPSALPSELLNWTSARLAPGLLNVMNVPHGGGFNQDCDIRRGHSHNDYHQNFPLSSALHHGITSVEVDVFPRKDELLVGHTRFELQASRTIKNMYIDPILRLLKKNGSASQNSRPHGRRKGLFPISRSSQSRRFRSAATHQSSNGGTNNNASSTNPLMNPEDETLILLVDFKADPDKSASLLHEALAPLRPYLSKVDKNGKFTRGKVTILISGNRPKDESLSSRPFAERVTGGRRKRGTAIASSADEGRYMFIDGRSRDIHSNTDTSLVPMVSVSWRSMQLARFIGRGEQYMAQMVKQAHDQGKRLRIWGAPNQERAWRQMVRSKVDLLSIDDHVRFARFAARDPNR